MGEESEVRRSHVAEIKKHKKKYDPSTSIAEDKMIRIT